MNIFREFEVLAYDLLQHCYENNQKNCEDLILLEDEKFDNESSFKYIYMNERKFGINFDEEEKISKHFVLHDCFQNVVERIWCLDCYKMSRIINFLIFVGIFLLTPFLWIIYGILQVNMFY